MSKKKRLSPNQKAELKSDLAGLKTIQGYNPSKQEYSLASLEAVDDQLDNVDEQVVQSEAHTSDLRSQSADLGDVYNKKLKGVRQQVVAQFGDDSPEFEAVGGIRTSHRKPSVRRGTGTTRTPPHS